MGCDFYSISEEVTVHFNEDQDHVPCLCTFPHNYEHDKRLDPETVRSLAYLGAMVVLLHRGQTDGDEFQYIPNDVPEWIRQEIERLAPGRG